MHKFMPMRGQDSFYTMASGGLGYSLPAAVGMALGRSEARTVCLIGDGSAMYSIQELWTAAPRRGDGETLILRSGRLAASRRMRKHRGLMVRDGARAPPHHEGRLLPVI